MIVTNRILALLQGKNIPPKTKEELVFKNTTPYKIHATIESEEGAAPTVTIEESFDDILEAVNAGRRIDADIDVDNDIVVHGHLVLSDKGESAIVCSVVTDLHGSGESPNPQLMNLLITENGVGVEALNLEVAQS